jgi:hypothetical protein
MLVCRVQLAFLMSTVRLATHRAHTVVMAGFCGVRGAGEVLAVGDVKTAERAKVGTSEPNGQGKGNVGEPDGTDFEPDARIVLVPTAVDPADILTNSMDA